MLGKKEVLDLTFFTCFHIFVEKSKNWFFEPNIAVLFAFKTIQPKLSVRVNLSIFSILNYILSVLVHFVLLLFIYPGQLLWSFLLLFFGYSLICQKDSKYQDDKYSIGDNAAIFSKRNKKMEDVYVSLAQEQKQLAFLSPPAAAAVCIKWVCNGRCSLCMWRWLKTAVLCQWNVSVNLS